ncbi:hypothetical protein EYF80_060667 [Liparis tanakae]|uniref:Uncharacterized protein n=1 Tax=Liparis tanakae TaxID=230148 RepID=A0A4Z2EL57_9TELE|nr:hypothetical protein EYF80_060667 [Liparis tanakae]
MPPLPLTSVTRRQQTVAPRLSLRRPRSASWGTDHGATQIRSRQGFPSSGCVQPEGRLDNRSVATVTYASSRDSSQAGKWVRLTFCLSGAHYQSDLRGGRGTLCADWLFSSLRYGLNEFALHTAHFICNT